MKTKPLLFTENIHRDSVKCVHCIYCINADTCNPNLCLDFICLDKIPMKSGFFSGHNRQSLNNYLLVTLIETVTPEIQ